MSLSPSRWDSEEDEDPLILEIASEEQQKLPATFLDFGPPLPSRYGIDQLELMVQSPLRVFAYWELKEATILRTLHEISAPDRPNFQLLLKWNETGAAQARYLDPGVTNSWWFDTLPERRYQLELGLYWGEYGWLPMIASHELVTPPLALGPAPEGEPPQIQAFLEGLVLQTGIALPTEGVSTTPATEVQPEAEIQSPESTDTTAPGNRDDEALTPNVRHDTEPSRIRPTSGW